MLTVEKQSKFMTDLMDEHKRSLEDFLRQLKAVQKIEAAGFEMIPENCSWLRTGLTIDKSRLPELWRKIGKCKVVSRNVPYDFDKKGELSIVLQPVDEDLKDITFIYRTKFRPGKCQVVEHINPYKTLVCQR